MSTWLNVKSVVDPATAAVAAAVAVAGFAS